MANTHTHTHVHQGQELAHAIGVQTDSNYSHANITIGKLSTDHKGRWKHIPQRKFLNTLCAFWCISLQCVSTLALRVSPWIANHENLQGSTHVTQFLDLPNFRCLEASQNKLETADQATTKVQPICTHTRHATSDRTRRQSACCTLVVLCQRDTCLRNQYRCTCTSRRSLLQPEQFVQLCRYVVQAARL